MNHTCHHPDCNVPVPPKMWGCKKHWLELPKWIRDRIWATYKPCQEITKTPSNAYIKTAKIAQKYIELSKKYGPITSDDFDDFKEFLKEERSE